MRWSLYTDRSVYVLSYDALIGQKDTDMKKAKKVKKVEYSDLLKSLYGSRDKEIATLKELVNSMQLRIDQQQIIIRDNDVTIKDEQSAVRALRCNMKLLDYRWRKVVEANTTGKGCCCTGVRCFKDLIAQEEKRLEKFR